MRNEILTFSDKHGVTATIHAFSISRRRLFQWEALKQYKQKDVYVDNFVVISSIDIIDQTRGGRWPTPDLTIEEDLIDLAWHQREFEAKSSFVFTVINKDQLECLGRIYFYPPEEKYDEFC